MLDFTLIDKNWTLFLDRDGVIDVDKEDSYIFNVQEFFFLEGVLAAVKKLNETFGVIVVATNQKGIGKGLMTVEDLDNIHAYMLDEINKAGGRIDKIYFASDLDDNSPNRKPQPGMAWQAKTDFPQIDFSKSIMVGNRVTDMQFGRNAGMHTVFLATTNPEIPFPNEFTDARFNSLYEFAQALPATKS
ncbi:D-glycero-alpha-D-manno-heptose-1,7-bisphosphate 7-phosphatase [Foetidibacter luteolus]|uniref:D-glycero-alpha-D-manno-heptose-1,7-bisphosphate 7-phosphatase n=1 Tax=Foetidibacter luteolus TaxID=2608880 RepID=UPI00129BD963|nr:HAD-IIIA family hydrolase [Foetidibacter luteolus]